MEQIEALKRLYANYKEQGLKDYFTFLRFPSVSTDPAYRPQLLACADWVVDYLKGIGFTVDVWPTSGHPTIFATYIKAGPSQPTLLIYNHYDVQPVDPLNLWQTPPFEPSIRDGEVYARGAQDNKGQCFYVLLALKALVERDGTLPINVKLCIEGEEECGSTGLSEIVASKAKELHADYLAIVDMGIYSLKRPAITLGTRGLITMDIEVTGSKTDLHSGSHGGIAYNPIHALTQLLTGVRDAAGKVVIPGFYDDILPISDEEKQQISWSFDVDEYKAMFGAEPTGGELGIQAHERNWKRPTFEVNGICGGYTGDGFKTVIPAKAHAKVSCRLVPGQDPDKVARLVEEYLKGHIVKGMEIHVNIHKGRGCALHATPASKIAQAFSQAYAEVLEAPCEMIYSGGSIPVAPALAEACGGEVVLMGYGFGDDNIHAPNEHFGVDRIEKGFLTIARTLEILSRNK